MKSQAKPSVEKGIAVVERLADLGTRYDAAPNFPVESLATLVSAGYHRHFAPRACGGATFADGPARQGAMSRALRDFGRGDLSIRRLYEGHVNALQLFD
ncbi:hypothetical protein FHS96_003941 [Sphingomonas zeicaulis]|uniref:hypothetical protein n=1 Tax=Sphingomonas zeicaulis TaxID=1632740 RepID=UPI003D19D836